MNKYNLFLYIILLLLSGCSNSKKTNIVVKKKSPQQIIDKYHANLIPSAVNNLQQKSKKKINKNFLTKIHYQYTIIWILKMFCLK